MVEALLAHHLFTNLISPRKALTDKGLDAVGGCSEVGAAVGERQEQRFELSFKWEVEG